MEARTSEMPESVFVVAADGEGAQWDKFVSSFAESSYCHLSGWREIMSDVLGHECIYTVALDRDGSWVAVLPLVRVRSRWLGHYLLSMPFLNYGGPVGHPEAQSRLAEHAVTEARCSGADLLEIRARQPIPGELRTVTRKITVLLELPASDEALWAERFPPKLRSQIRRPMKEGMEACFGSEQLEPFYEVFSRHMRDLGTPVLPRGFFERISGIFADIAVFGVVYRREQPVAAGCGFVWRDEFELSWASSLLAHKRAAPNMLLYWSFMQRMIARGIRVFNFGRCTPGGGTHRFKGQWGGFDVPLPWAQWSPSGVTATPSPDRPIYRLAAAAWRRLPQPVADRLGPVIARRLP
jgi:serine/alanine adding enzyme